MEKGHRDIILKNLNMLINDTTDEAFENLLNKFSDNNGLSPFMIAKIMAGKSNEERKKIFYEMVPKRGPYAFNKLCDCLFKVGLGNIASCLKETRILLDGGACSNFHNSDSETRSCKKRYSIKSNPKGYVLIININTFKYNPQEKRNGSEKDVAYLNEVWTKLGFRVIIKEDLMLEEFKNVIDNFINLTKSEKLDSILIFIMTHGNRNEKNHREVLLKMSDNQDINSEWIIDRFSSVHSKCIADIPKVIFIQACRGHEKDLGHWLEHDSARVEHNNNNTDGEMGFIAKPNYSNLLVVFSTLPGFVSKRNSDGTPFIQELCSSIKSKAKTHHLIDIIHEVDRKLYEEVIESLKNKEPNYFQTIHYDNWHFNCNLYLY